MKSKTISSQAKRRLFIFGPICLGFIGLLIYSLTSFGYEVYTLRQEQNALDTKYIQLHEMTDQLQIEIIKLQDPEYIARFVREQYLYSRADELIIRINDENETEETTSSEEKAYDRMIINISIGVLSLIFIYIILKGIKKRNRKK